MSSFSHFVTSPPSPERNTAVFQSTDYCDSPLRSPLIHRVPLVAITEDQEFSDSALMDLSMPLLRRSTTAHDFSPCFMMDDIPALVEEVSNVSMKPTMCATDEAINDSNMPSKIDASKLMKVPITPTKKAKRTKHRRSNCVFI
jgi:hypothetical protein